MCYVTCVLWRRHSNESSERRRHSRKMSFRTHYRHHSYYVKLHTGFSFLKEVTLTHLLGQQVNVLLVAAVRGVVQLDQGQRLRKHKQRWIARLALMHQNAQTRNDNTPRFDSVAESLTCVVAVMESTKVGTVEQLRFSRRPCRRKRRRRVVSMENCKALQWAGEDGGGRRR